MRLDISIGASLGNSRTITGLTELIRERFEARRQSMHLPQSTPRTEAPTIVLWRYPSPMEGYDDNWVPHRVVRQTEESVLVEANPLTPENQRLGRSAAGRVRTYWVDRVELERAGFARVRSCKTVFFSSRIANLELVHTVEALLRLGLWLPYSEDDLKQAYRRRALQVHPDAGGSEARFVQLQEDHDRAFRALSQDWWA